MKNNISVTKVRAGFEKMTHYGPGYTVVVRPDPANISHTHHRIFFHTDLTYYDYMPGVRTIDYPGDLGVTLMLSDCVPALHCPAPGQGRRDYAL